MAKQHDARQLGFTLLEVLVSIAIFSVIAIVSYTTLDTYIDHRERLTQHYGKLERLQRVFVLLERDMQFIIDRNVRSGGDIEPAVKDGDGDAFISMTVAEPDINTAQGVALRRIEWRLKGKEMIRASWDVLDQDGNVEPLEFIISDEIEDIELTYFFYKPNQGLESESSLDKGAFPDGIEVNLTLASGETYRRLFGVARGANSINQNSSGRAN